MNIAPIRTNSAYNLLSFNYKSQIIWNIQGPLSGDSVAGFIVGLTTIINDILINGINMLNDYTVELITENKIIEINLNKQANINNFIRNYIINTNVSPEKFDQYYYLLKPSNISEFLPEENPDLLSENYGWWITEPLNQKSYTLYNFSSADFIQGFISICNIFAVDFRDYILGTPFKYNNATHKIVNYEIEGYDVKPFKSEHKRKQTITPFYTGIYEGDVHDFV